jgi:DNA-directed RNA polymerase subunit RPC12/RpoP
MTLTEKAAYIKGLRDGLNLNGDSSEGKVLNAIIDLISDMALTVEDLEETTLAISDDQDELWDEIDEIEDYLDDEFEYDDEDDDDDFDLWDDGEYEITCPNCNETIEVDAEDLAEGFDCPNCGAKLEGFEAEDVDDEA